MYTISAKINGCVLINGQPFTVGDLRVQYDGSNVIIYDKLNMNVKLISASYDQITNPSTGLPFASADTLKTFVQTNFFDLAAVDTLAAANGYTDDNVKYQVGGNTRAQLFTDKIKYFDPLQRGTSTAIASGTKIGIFDNNTAYGTAFTIGTYTLDSNGLTKTSVTRSDVLMFPESMSGDIDVEYAVSSAFLINPTPNFPPNSGMATLLRVQDENNHCKVTIDNPHTTGAVLTIREVVAGVETVIGTYTIGASDTTPKISNVWPTIRVILRGNRVTVSLNGVRVLNNIYIPTVRYGRHGFRIYKQGTNIKNIIVRENSIPVSPAIQVEKRKLLYGDGNMYNGWADCAALNDGSVFVVWRQSPLNTPSGGHEQGGSILCAKWRNGTLGTPVVLYAAEGTTVNDLQEQDCVLSKVYYNGRDQLILFTRKYKKADPSGSTCYVSTCDIGLNDPTDPTKWSARVAVAFPAQTTSTVAHAQVIMDKNNLGFITAFYGTKIGGGNAIWTAGSSDMVTWVFKGFALDPTATVNPVPGGDFEPRIIRGTGASLLITGRARITASHNDGEDGTFWAYDSFGGNGGRTNAFGSGIRLESGALAMQRRYTNQTTPADTSLVVLQVNDGINFSTSDWSNGTVIEQQFPGFDKPGLANPGGDNGCPRAARIGERKYLLLNYVQDVNEMAPRLYQYILTV